MPKTHTSLTNSPWQVTLLCVHTLYRVSFGYVGRYSGIPGRVRIINTLNMVKYGKYGKT